MREAMNTKETNNMIEDYKIDTSFAEIQTKIKEAQDYRQKK